MENYQICIRCVMDTTVPDITFDDSGVCNYCRSAEERLKNELYVSDDNARTTIDEIVDKIKSDGKRKPYDCIIGVSGGVDSSYTAYLVKKYGLRPLAVHFDNGWNSELAVKNIELLLNKLGIDLYTHVVDWEEFRDLQLSFLKASVANSEIPTDHAIVSLMYGMAAKYGVKYIISGGNLATESIMPDSWMHDAKDLRFLKSIHRQFGTRKLKTTPLMGYSKLAWYILAKNIKYVGILNYINYDKQSAMKTLESELGWRKYEGKHFESIYTKFFQSYLLPEKFKMDKRKPHLSSLIVSGQMTRDDALSELNDAPYNAATIKQEIEYVRQKFGLTESEFNDIMNSPVKSSDDYPNSEWLLRKLSPLVKQIKKLATGRD